MEKGRAVMGSGHRWAVDFTGNSTAPSTRDIPDPPGINRSSQDQDDSAVSKQKKDPEADWKSQVPSMPRSSDDAQTMQYPSKSIGVKATKSKARGKGKATRRTIDDEQSKESQRMQCMASIKEAAKKAEKVVDSERAKMEYYIAQREFVQRISESDVYVANTTLLTTLMQKGELSTTEKALRDKLIGIIYDWN